MRIYALVRVYLSTTYYVITKYITTKSTFPRAKSCPVCDQYWSRDNLIANIRLIIDVPQYIECTSIVGYFINNKIVVTCLMNIDSHGDFFLTLSETISIEIIATRTDAASFNFSVKIRIFDYSIHRRKMFFEIICARNEWWFLENDATPRDCGNGKG